MAIKTTKEINDELQKKLQTELDSFIGKMLEGPKYAFQDGVDEYAIKKDIVNWFNYEHLPPDKAEALLQLDNPLEDIFNDFMDSDAAYFNNFEIEKAVFYSAERKLKSSLSNKISDASSRAEQKTKEATKEKSLSEKKKDKEK